MTATAPSSTSHSERSAILALGFGTTVAMWAVGYVCRLPGIVAPAPLLLFLLLGCHFFAGFAAGRWTRSGWKIGFAAGLLTSVVNLLVLGSLLTSDQPNLVVPSALWWIPGSMLVAVLITTLGAIAGGWSENREGRVRNWSGGFAVVTSAATLLLLGVGGLVTTAEAGLAVVDWPNSFGYNMFLYPLSRMTGGIYYEHAHRLFGALVGLTTLVLAVHLQVVESRPWVKRLAWSVLALVVGQGIMGGLRVTELNIYLAVAHGVLGQIIFAMLAALALVTSTPWRSARAIGASRAPFERRLGVVLLFSIVLQILLGALYRHLGMGLMIHISCAMIVLLIAAAVGFRAWALYRDQEGLKRLGLLVLGTASVQVLLGFFALAVVGVGGVPQIITTSEMIFATLHQAFAAVFLAVSLLLVLWTSLVLGAPRAAEKREPSGSGS